MSAVVDKRVNSFLKHSLFVSYNNVGSVKLFHLGKTVISVYYSSVKIVKIGCCKSAAVEHYHRTKIRRNNGYAVKYHPFGTVAAESECFDNIKSLEQLNSLLSLLSILKLFLELLGQLVKVYLTEQFLDSLSAHLGSEVIFITLSHISVLFFGEQLSLCENRIAGIYYDILCEVKNFFKSLG